VIELKKETTEILVPRAESILGLTEVTLGYSCEHCGAMFVNEEACGSHEATCSRR